MKRICIVGTGYVGLVTGACFADLGNQVVCLDVDEHKIAQIKQNVMPIYEPGVEELVRHNRAWIAIVYVELCAHTRRADGHYDDLDDLSV